MLRELSLFTGYGGFTLGLRLAGLEVRTVGYVEIETYCQGVIKARIKDGLLDDAPIWDDIRTFGGGQFRGLVDIATAGFPCQPHSAAGQRRGASDDRNLWPDTLRVIGEVGPPIVLLENVPGILANGYAGTVVGQLSALGYDCRTGLVPAAAVGAPHLRWRWWCLAYTPGKGFTQGWRTAQQKCQHEEVGGGEQLGADGQDGDVANARQQHQQLCGGRTRPESETSREDVADSHGPRPPDIQGQRTDARTTGDNQSGSTGWWAVEPPLGRVAHGTPHRVGQLRALGNGVVPAVVAEFLRRVREL